MASLPGGPFQAVSEGDAALPPDKNLAGLGMKRTEDDQTTPTGTKITTWFTQNWEDLRSAYTVYHQLCWQNILFYAGELWIQWDRSRKVYYSAVPEDEYTPMPNVNEFAPGIDAITSVYQIPNVQCTPKNEGDTDAHEIAEIANEVANEVCRRNGMAEGGTTKDKDGVGDRAGQLFTLCGNLFTITDRKQANVSQVPIMETVPMMQVTCPLCKYQNQVPPDDPSLMVPPSSMLMGQQVSPGGMSAPCPKCGAPMESQPTQKTQQATDPTTGQPATRSVITWEVRIRVGNPLFCLPQPGAISQHAASYHVWAERMQLDDIYKEWNYEAQPDNQFLDTMESSWEIAMNFYFTGYSSLTLASKNSALVCIIFIEPDRMKEIPEGGVAVWCNGKVIHLYKWEEYCPIGHALTHIGYLNMPTTYFYRTPAMDMANVQRELNRYESIIALHGMTSASDSLIIDENTKVSNVSGRGDRIIYWRSIGPGSREPHRLEHGTLDSGVYEQRQHLRDVLQNISGAVAVFRGQQAGSVTSAAGISQLRGQAEQMFSKPVNNWKQGWVQTISKGVELAQQSWQEWEILKFVGPGKEVQIAKFKQAKLSDLLTWAAGQHGLPQTRDEKRQDLLDLYDRKMLDTSDPDVRSRINELFGESGLENEFNLDATRARWENGQLSHGQEVQFMPEIEDLATHLAIHGKIIKRLDFDKLDDNIKELIFNHYMETKMALQQQSLMAQESQVEYKAASIGKAAPGQAEPGTLLGGGPDAQGSDTDGGNQGPGPQGGGDKGGSEPGESRRAPRGQRGGRPDGGPHHSRRPVAAGQGTVPTGPNKRS
jgi:hypothetical protein